MPEVSSIGKYQVLERIATGDLAEIFKARLEGIAGFRRMFAIKRVRPHLARNQAYAQMIEEEARIAGLLSHGNIVQLLDLGRDGGALYLVMEFVDGWDLGALEARAAELGQPVPVQVVLHLGIELLKALEYAHKREIVRDGEVAQLGLIHRDISPSNILVGRQGEVKLTDFGIARASLKLMETHPDLVRRTFDYMSPEGSRGRDLSQAADLFAVGVVLFELLTGHHPFRREGEMATLEAIQDGVYTPVVELRGDVPMGLIDALAAAMSVDPVARPMDATEFKEQLVRVQAELATVEGAFTQERMAGWLRELFPEPVAAAPAPVPSAALPRAPVHDLPDLPEEAEPTVPAAHPGAVLGAHLKGPVAAAVQAATAPGVGLRDLDTDDAATVVGGPADAAMMAAQGPPALRPLTERVPAPRPSSGAFSDEEAATVVNLDLAGRLEELRAARTAPARPSAEGAAASPPRAEDRAVESTQGGTRSSVSISRSRGAPTRVDAPVSTTRLQIAGAVLGLVVLVVGGLLGVLGTLIAQRNGSMVVQAPKLEIRTDPGVAMAVTVDGQPFAAGAHDLAAGTHPVRVQVDGAQPWDFDLVLQAGEYRVMVITSHQVQLQAPSSGAPAEPAAKAPAGRGR